MYTPKIAIIVTTYMRDNLLVDCLNSIIDVWQEDWKVIVVDQNLLENDLFEKAIIYNTIASEYHDSKEQRIEVVRVPPNSGISYSRNVGVEYAKSQNIPCCIISADSIWFTESMKSVNTLSNLIQRRRWSLIGMDIFNRGVGWEAKLNLHENSHFELDFVDKNKVYDFEPSMFFKCDIVRNFFIASTDSLYQTKWDNDLIMREHEDFFWRYKLNNHKVLWTNYCGGVYVGAASKASGEYARIRRQNWNDSKDVLFKKYNLKSWVKYKNLPKA